MIICRSWLVWAERSITKCSPNPDCHSYTSIIDEDSKKQTKRCDWIGDARIICASRHEQAAKTNKKRADCFAKCMRNWCCPAGAFYSRGRKWWRSYHFESMACQTMDKARAHGARGCRFEFCSNHSRSQFLQTHIIRLYLKRPCRNSPTRQKLSMPQICILALEASTRVRNDDTGRHGQCVHMQYTTKSLAPAA